MNAVISIITPSFNRADIVHETAESIFAQTYPNWEWVIVDDGSTDQSWSVLQSFAQRDSRVKIYKRERQPKGACTCRNIAVEKSAGEYLIFLDTDDLLASYCLEQRMEAFHQDPDNDFLIFPMLLFQKKIDDTRKLWNIDSDQDDLERVLVGDPVCQGTGTLWKKSSFLKIGLWNENLLLWQDVELHLRSFIQGLGYAKRFDLPPDVFLRISDVSLSRTGFHSLPKLSSRIEVLVSTYNNLCNHGLFEKYMIGLRYMFIELYLNAVKSNYANLISSMLQLQRNWNLFETSELMILRSYALLYRTKLYKLPFLEQYLIQKIKLISGTYTSVLGQIAYSQPINS